MQSHSYRIPSFIDITSHPGARLRQFRLQAKIVPTDKRETPEEETATISIDFIVSCSDRLSGTWKISYEDGSLAKILFEFGRKHLEEKLRRGEISQIDDLTLETSIAPDTCPYNPRMIEIDNNRWYEVEVRRPIGFGR